MAQTTPERAVSLGIPAEILEGCQLPLSGLPPLPSAGPQAHQAGCLPALHQPHPHVFKDCPSLPVMRRRPASQRGRASSHSQLPLSATRPPGTLRGRRRQFCPSCPQPQQLLPQSWSLQLLNQLLQTVAPGPPGAGARGRLSDWTGPQWGHPFPSLTDTPQAPPPADASRSGTKLARLRAPHSVLLKNRFSLIKAALARQPSSGWAVGDPQGCLPSDPVFRAAPRVLVPSLRSPQSGSGTIPPSGLCIPEPRGFPRPPHAPPPPGTCPRFVLQAEPAGRGGTWGCWPEWQKVSGGGRHPGTRGLRFCPSPELSVAEWPTPPVDPMTDLS